jgi:small-conductance mechanosensitive channel
MTSFFTHQSLTHPSLSNYAKQIANFKPRLEKILKDVVLLTEIAELAEEADQLDAQDSLNQSLRLHEKPVSKKGLGGSVKWSEVAALSSGDISDFERDHDDEDDDDASKESPSEGGDTPAASERNRPQLSISNSGDFRIKDLLDRWQEPVNKLDKTTDASIHGILKFNRALSYMDESHPFGESFGPASTRNQQIASAHSVYYRLLKLTPDVGVVSNDILLMIAQDEDGNVLTSKKNALSRMFRPDRYNQLPLLAFLQSCDTLYKKLRYFRASVGNASVIDHVLEGMIDVLFAFVLFLVILSVMNFNPWPLLVSLSTLLVSFSFAMGSSASKCIEGILLIAVRRPFDLGDRIVLSTASGQENPGVANSWFVEDISLYSTTLRFAQSNEVATVSNGTISECRIVNCNRSPNAMVAFDLVLHICLIKDGKVDGFTAAIENYIHEHPRVWDCLVFFRYDKFDADMEQVFCRIAVRHRDSWQDAMRILRDRGEFQNFVYALGMDMGVNFDSPPARRLIYTGGILKSGQVVDYKRNLLTPANIKNAAIMGDTAAATSDNDVANALFMAQLQKSNTVM